MDDAARNSRRAEGGRIIAALDADVGVCEQAGCSHDGGTTVPIQLPMCVIYQMRSRRGRARIIRASHKNESGSMSSRKAAKRRDRPETAM
jgi:hypothetical protein